MRNKAFGFLPRQRRTLSSLGNGPLQKHYGAFWIH